ncbi:MAG: sigma 54-interacting transcriptional regulator [Fusobacteriaceae bacterium]|nr:sigma 54-interacting transcriptional regulator [Fusobacteriaceae bacterium]MBN2838443.1 sigma 54-interacting transcriptional regulator [Fusobacteriaceae bacterium]
MKKYINELENLKNEKEVIEKKLFVAENKIIELEKENLTAFAVGDVVMDGIFVLNLDGVITKINKGYTDITGIEEKDILGKSIWEIEQEKYFTEDISFEILKTRKKTTAMATILKNDKRVLMTGSPIFDKNGEFIKIIVVIRDITSLINLREQLEKVEEKKRIIQNKLNTLINVEEWKHFKGNSPKVNEIKELIKYVAPTDASIFIIGDTGTGKEVVAKEIYERSKRFGSPYIKINCAAIPENLLESELFGYEKGAFTGADNKAKKGLFEIANGGTILLDEITELPLSLQPKLLRVLQEREITPLGGIKSIKIDTRVIVACNKDPEVLIKKGLFRADLFYRLNVFPINLPSLKDRKEDIPDISMLFLERFNKTYDKNKVFDNTAFFALMSYNWPGNVRELENTLERMTIMSPNKILTNIDVKMAIDINKNFSIDEKTSDTLSLKENVNNLERQLIEEALKKGGSSYAAAEILKTTQPTIVRKAKSLGIKVRQK